MAMKTMERQLKLSRSDILASWSRVIREEMENSGQSENSLLGGSKCIR